MLGVILGELESKGHKATAVPVERLDELREHYEELSREGRVDAQIARELLAGLTLSPPEAFPDPRSLIVVATEDPVVLCTFRWQGNDVVVPIPPTYLHYKQSSEDIARTLRDLLPQDCHVESLYNAPHKLLAARSGLSRYGRNNITYIPGLGSFFRLTTICTDVPCGDGEWPPPEMMPTCEGCTQCIEACPTGAIHEERFLLRAELCITNWNEKPGDVPFPCWLERGWHDSVVGCLHCQLACPENEMVRDHRKAGPSFTEAETEALLRGGEPGDLPTGLPEKLEEWDLTTWLGVLPRNLAVHLTGADPSPAE